MAGVQDSIPFDEIEIVKCDKENGAITVWLEIDGNYRTFSGLERFEVVL